MFGRDQIDIRLRNKQGDRFLLTHQRFHSLHKERLSFRSTRRDAWNFLFDLQLGQFNELEEKLKDHPLLKNPHHTGYKSTRRLIEDALNWGSLNVFVIHRDQSRNLKQIETLYDRIKMKLGMIIASEKAEAAVIDQQYQALDSGGKIQAHAHRFGQGLKQAGHSLLTWLGEVHDVVSKVKQRGRVYEAYLKTQTHDSVIDWYKEFNEHWREAEYKEIVDVLGFDPKKISSEDFSQAWAMSQILWEDERCQTLPDPVCQRLLQSSAQPGNQ